MEKTDERKNDLLTYQEARSYLFDLVSVSYLQKLVSRQEIPFMKIGRAVRFKKSDLDTWLEQRRVPAAGGAK